MAKEFTLEEALAPPPKAAPKAAPKEFTLEEVLAAPAAESSTAARDRAEAQARQDIASQGPEQISIPEAELADAQRNVAALTRELKRKGVDAGPPPAIGSSKAGDFLLAQGAKTQSQRPAPAAAVVPPAPPVAQTQLAPPPAPPVAQVVPPKPVDAVAAARAAIPLGASPKFIESMRAELYRLSPEKRAAAIQNIIKEYGKDSLKGRVVRFIEAENARLDAATNRTPALESRLGTAMGLKKEAPVTGYASDAIKKLSPRIEDIAASTQAKYPERPAELILLDAQRAIEQGRTTVDYDSAQRDVVGEQAAAAAERQARELKDAGLSKRVGAGVMSEGTKSVAGVGQFLADITGDEEFSQELANTQRIEGAKAAAIPQGKSIFDRSFQGAATSLATQAPFLVLSALTGSPTPVLAQVGLTSFGKFYGEGRAAGLDTAKSTTRATAMTAAEIVFERLGMTKALAGLKEFVAKNGAENVYKYVGKAIATELPTEMATTISQYGIDVLPSVGLNKKPSLLDLYQQVEETLRQTVLQAGATAGVTVAAVKGVQGAKATPQAIAEARERLRETSNKIVGIEKTNELLGLREGAYERPAEGLAGDMAQSRRVPFASTSGTLSVPPVEKAAAEPKLGNLENVGMREEEEPELLGTKYVPPVEKAAAEPKLGDLENVGMQEEEEPGLGNLENVQAGTEPSMAKGEAAPTAEDTGAKVNAIAERLRSRGIPRENALRIAQKQVAEEQAKGAKDAARTEPPPSGESVSVAGQPGAEAPGGLETPARDGVVPAATDAGLAATGETPEPAALTEPPVTEGMTRLYHGSATPGRYTGAAWFSTDKDYAQNYRQGAELQYVDVPTKWVNEKADPDNYGQTPAKGFTFNTELDSSFTGPRKPLTETKGTTDGAETVEAKQTETQEQEAPAAPVKVRKTEPVVNENGAFIPAKEKGGELETTAYFKVLDEDNDVSDDLVGATMITGMGATKEGQGEGSKLLKAITAWADANGKKLVLVPAATPKGERGLSQEQLKAWYARNGFEDRIDYMVREPGGKKAEAPAAPKPPKAVKPGKEVHTTPQNAEGKWEHAINGEVIGTFDTKRQATAAMQLDKAKKTGNEELIAKNQKVFDAAMNPLQRGRPPKIIPFESTTTETVTPEAVPEADAQDKMDADMAAYEANKAKVEGIARANAQGAFDQVGEYDGDIDASVDSHRQNTHDTLEEEGLKQDPRYDRLSDAADRAFDAEVAKLKEKAKVKAEAETAAKVTEPKLNLTAEEKERLEELDDLYRNATNNPNTEGGKAAQKTLERVTKDFDEPKVVRERAKAMLAGEYSTLAIQAAQGKKDLAFSKFTTSSQTLSHIIKTGTDFQKALARRLRSTVRNVKMVVVEKGQELPASVAAVKAKWDRALAMYNTEEKVVYTKGESYGKTNGLNAVVQLHELFHGATSQKIRTALAYMKMGRHVDSQMVTAVKGLQKIMDAARADLNKQIEAGTVDPDVHGLAVYGEAFTNLHEFVSYGNTDAKLQEFLKGVKGFEKNESLFSPFVDALRRMIGVAKEDANALSDLIQHTDQLISSRRPGGWGFPEAGTLASAAIPPPPGERTQEEMDADDAAAWSKVDRTQMGQKRADALSSFMALRDPRVIWARLEGVWDKIDDPTRKAIALFFDRNGIANTIGKHIPVLYDIADRLQKMDGMAASLRGEAAKQAGMVVNFARKDRKAMEVLNRLIPASTIAGYDPANPPASGVRATKTDEAYEALKPAGQRVYREVRDYFADMYNAARDIMEASVDSLDLPADAKQKLMASIRLAFEEGKIEPYFPLMRYGDYIFRIKERGSDKYESYRFETKAERNFAAKAYAKEQGVKLKDLVEDNEVALAKDRGGKEQRGIVENSKLLKEMYEAIDSMDTTDAKAKAKLKDNMYQVYLDLMPEASMRKQFIHREGTVGFGTDTLRMINTQGIKIASALSKLQYGNEIRNLSEQANRQLKGKEQYKAFVGAMDSVIDEALNPKPLGPVAGFFDPVAQQWTKFTFFHNLTSLSSALMQPADILLTGAPVLVGNHGPKATVELTKMANVVKQFGVWETLPDGTKRFRAPSIAYAKGLPQVELDAIADMVGAYGLSSDTLANEIFDAATKPIDKADPKAVEFAKNAGKLLVFGGLMHHTERISREVIGAVSFRLHYAEMEKASPGNPTNYANAVRAAVAEANEALGDYSPGNRPQIMRGPIGKLLSTYKFFPLTRIKLLGGNFFRMIPFLNKEGKIAAATKFFGILGTHSILTGVVGLPMYGLIQALWGQWQKDEDAPQTMKDLDHDTWWRTEFLRAELGDGQFTRFAKEIAKSGIANYATGMAISERLGLNDMVFRTPSPGKNLKESVANYAEAFFGAQLTPIKATQDSWDYYSQGEYQKMFESLPFMPKSISALSAMERVSREGIETKQGIPILDKGEVTTKELIGQALGFQSARVAEARRIAYATDLIERGISTEKQAIVGKAATMFLKAINPNRDPEDRQRFLNMYLETVQKIPKFNIKYPEYGIDGKEIDAKIDAELEKIAASKMFGGVKINDNNLRLFIQAALASREALNNPK